jgi:hypothetical protein
MWMTAGVLFSVMAPRQRARVSFSRMTMALPLIRRVGFDGSGDKIGEAML